MTAPVPFVQRVLLLGLAAIALHVPLVPVSHAADRAGVPDLLFCLLAAWTARRPDAVPMPLVLLLGLAADVLLGRPLGLGALALLLATEVCRSRLRRASLLVEWAAVVALFAVLLAGSSLLLVLTLAPGPGNEALVGHWLATALAYPLVAMLVRGVLRLGAPS